MGEGRGGGVSGRMDVTFVPGHVQVLIKCLFVRSLVITSDLEAVASHKPPTPSYQYLGALRGPRMEYIYF